MHDQTEILDRVLRRALSGEGAHAALGDLFDGLDWRAAGARPDNSPHSVFQLLNHMTYWQDWAVKWLEGGKPPTPRRAAGSWPGEPAPAAKQEWEQAVRHFGSGLEALGRQSCRLDRFARHGSKTRLEMLHTIASHNSYHAGQVALLRRMLGAWPPPSGGLSW